MRFDLDPIEALEAAPVANGTPLLLAVDSIDEDPEQPRTDFDPQALRQLADTIEERGVRQPISVRVNPAQPGRWFLNCGARRLRASRLAGKTEIPAFVDSTANSYDQVIENEQRENLTPLELAMFVEKQIKAGVTQAEIARRLGKTRGYLTFVGALIEPPDWLLDLYRSGRCRGLTELYDLRKLHETRPDEVARWLATQSNVARADVQVLKDSLKALEGESHPARSGTGQPCLAIDEVVPTEPSLQLNASTPESPSRANSPIGNAAIVLQARLDGADVTIDLGAVPAEEGCIFVRRDRSADRIPVPANRLQLLRAVKARSMPGV